MSEPTQTAAAPEPQHAGRKHHPFSPSSLQPLENSPCYIGRASDPDSPNTAAERGTMQHEAVESGSVAAILDDDEAAAVSLALDYVMVAERELGPDALVLREEYRAVDDRETTAGYCDCIVVSGDRDRTRIRVLDWKFGKYAVEPAENNLQGIAYGLGAVRHVEKTFGTKVTEFEVVFLSPHIEECSRHTFPRSEFPALLLRVVRTVEVAREVRRKIEAGDWSGAVPTTSACLFCGRLAQCPAVREQVFRASKKYSPVVFPDDVDIRGLDLDQPDKAAIGLSVARIAESWSKEFRKRVTDRAFLDEAFVPDGHYLMVTYPRKVVNPRGLLEAAARVANKHADDPELWQQLVSVPLTPIEKMVSDAAPRGDKKTAVEEFQQRLEDGGLVEKSATPVISLRMKSKGT